MGIPWINWSWFESFLCENDVCLYCSETALNPSVVAVAWNPPELTDLNIKDSLLIEVMFQHSWILGFFIPSMSAE